jgi:dipeptidyl aminopeptidase/acylaminoacyl peptidase
VATRCTSRPSTPAASYVYEFSWSPDAQRIAYVSAPAPGDNNWWVAKLYVQGAQANAAPTVLVDPGSVSGDLHGLQIALPRWSPDGTRIAFIGGLMSDQGSTGGDIYAVSSSGGGVTNLTPGIGVSPAWLSWNSDHQLLVAQVRGGDSEVAEYRIDADKATQDRVLFNLPASISDGSADMALSLSKNHQQIAYVQSSYAQAPEVHVGALGTAAPKAITTLNAALKPSWGKAESVQWHNEGRSVQGWLLYPAGYDASKSYPMIVMVHGGPSAATIPRWPSVGFGSAPLSALGYFVLMPNPRGSFGQGEAFVQANRKDFGYGDLRDTLAGVDAVEKKLPVDDKRLGLTGWSYGGFMSMFAPTQTQRFRAVVAGAGISNWQSYYGENLIDQWMIPFFGKSVYDDPAVYAKSSAINFVKQIKTPMLIVVGDRDAECPAPQSFELWHALRAQGVPTSLVVYPDEGHHFEDPAHQRDVLQRALGWFEKYLPPSK